MSLSVSNFNDFPVHEIPTSINSIKLAVLIVGLIKFALLQILLRRKMIAAIFSAIHSSVFEEERDDRSAKTVDVGKKVASGEEDDESSTVCGGDVEMILKSLGIFCSEKMPARVAISEIFEEREASLDEVREAFDVFDENRDGFIDEKELQRVLCALGFKEGLNMENCRRMIVGFDEDGDGKIDFHEFLKFMENCLNS